MQTLKLTKNNVLIIFVGILSSYNIAVKLPLQDWLSLLVSAIGLAGLTLYFLKDGRFRHFIWIWITAQLLIIDHSYFGEKLHAIINKPVWDLSQAFHLKLGFSVSGDKNSYDINLNLLAIFYFFLFKNLKVYSYLGKSYPLIFQGGHLDVHLKETIFVKLLHHVTLESDSNWLLGDLTSSICYNNVVYERVLLYTEGGMLTHNFLLVPPGIPISKGTKLAHKFEKAEWIRIG